MSKYQARAGILGRSILAVLLLGAFQLSLAQDFVW